MEEKEITDRIDWVMDHFDFHKVHIVMESINWRWASANGVPSVAQLKMRARKLLRKAHSEKAIVETGGLVADYDDEELSLKFVLAQSSDEYYEDLKE